MAPMHASGPSAYTSATQISLYFIFIGDKIPLSKYITFTIVTTCSNGSRTMAINKVIIDKILMLRKEGHMGARGIYIGMRRQAPELGPMRYAHAGSARDRTSGEEYLIFFTKLRSYRPNYKECNLYRYTLVEFNFIHKKAPSKGKKQHRGKKVFNYYSYSKPSYIARDYRSKNIVYRA